MLQDQGVLKDEIHIHLIGHFSRTIHIKSQLFRELRKRPTVNQRHSHNLGITKVLISSLEAGKKVTN